MNGIIGYPLKGVDVEITKAWRGDSVKTVRTARLAQGEQEYFDARGDDKRYVANQWNSILVEQASEKRKDRGRWSSSEP